MLYQAYHEVENVSRQLAVDSGQLAGVHYDVVGPICESTDCFRKDVELPESFRGDLIAVRTAGAYGEVMASGYNLRTRAESVYSE
jgi:diaminopimelate decarboxylase